MLLHRIWYIPGQNRFSTGEADGPLTFFATRLRCRWEQDSTDVRLEQTKRKRFKCPWRICFKQRRDFDFRCPGHGMFPAFSFVVSTRRIWVHSSLMWPKKVFSLVWECPGRVGGVGAAARFWPSLSRVLVPSKEILQSVYSFCLNFSMCFVCSWSEVTMLLEAWHAFWSLHMFWDSWCSARRDTRFTVLSHNPLCTTQLESSRPKAPNISQSKALIGQEWRFKLLVGRYWFQHILSVTWRSGSITCHFGFPSEALWTRPFFFRFLEMYQ